MYTAERYHDISCGHRVHGHESKCAHFHGHNYRFHFECEQIDQKDPLEAVTERERKLDNIGRVIDFSVIKSELCMWLEDNWDHRFLIWEKDPAAGHLVQLDDTVVVVPFNPTAENMAAYMVHVVGPSLLLKHGVRLIRCRVDETAKCSATYYRESNSHVK